MKYENRYYSVNTSDEMLEVRQKSAGVVIVTRYKGKVLLIQIQRIDGRLHLEMPRGFVEADEIKNGVVDYAAAAKRELFEELKISDLWIKKIIDLGEIMPDSGFIRSQIHVVLVELEQFEKDAVRVQVEEKIKGVELTGEKEIGELVESGEIIDGFSLAGILKLEVYDNRF